MSGLLTACTPPRPNCRTDTGPTGYSVRLCLVVPTGRPADAGRVAVAATVQVTGSAPAVNEVAFRLDGSYLLSAEQDPYSFLLHAYRYPPGRHVLSASVAFSGGFTTPFLDTPLDLAATPPPAPPPRFRPTPGLDPPAGAPFVAAAVGDGASGLAAQQQVTDLIASWNPDLFLYLGDVYEHGMPEEFANWYGEGGSRFSRFRSITNPTLGNHEFEGDRTGAPYFAYWGDPPSYYSYDTHGWHIVTLDDVGPTTALSTGSPQYRWLAADLVAHPDPCTLVTYHRPRFTVGRTETDGGPSEAATDFDPFWRLLAAHHVPVVLNGHSHNYQRWKPMNADGVPVAAGGTTEFVAGTGGQWLSPLVDHDPRLVVGVDNQQSAWGALRLQLSATGLSYRFVTTAGTTVDAGSVPCAPSGPG